ncbi:MAG: hypothetical protein GKR88_15015 [Flavobacteriaceae bacterium]|nr:MAG: hypothetical protein GKR88_15015 [Flavobacteriaceae bacterium]
MSQDKLYQVVWSDLADETYGRELNFIDLKWNINEVVKFMTLVDEFIEKLESGVIAGKFFKHVKINSFVLSKQTTLFFDIDEAKKEIELLLFWNNKENPEDLETIIKRLKK